VSCGGKTTTTQQGEWYEAEAHCTKAFAAFLLRALVNSPISDVVSPHDVSYAVVRGVLARYVGDEVDWRQFARLRVLGLDEISLRKGHRDFVTIVSTQDEAGHPSGLAVLKGREKKIVVAFLQSIPEPVRATIEQACTDLYEGFANAVKEVLPHVKRVADSFHVAKLSRAAVEDLRKQEMNALKQTLPKEEYARLKGVLWRLRRNFADLSEADKQLLERLFDHSPRLRQAHALREQVTTILGQKLSKEAAPRALRAWTEEVKRSGLNVQSRFN
jgi:transposase